MGIEKIEMMEVFETGGLDKGYVEAKYQGSRHKTRHCRRRPATPPTVGQGGRSGRLYRTNIHRIEFRVERARGRVVSTTASASGVLEFGRTKTFKEKSAQTPVI